ncbi:sigma-54-dependent transcriptional regulator [Lysobacter korlensis]|uniref:Sigma-54-dependent transcriptional regulator n=1 Tax=Lysobacter korlensis TaxID=553636 RepID=A0ABV6RIH4_9GAMM
MTPSLPSVLIVDDDVDFANAAADFARTRGFRATLAHSLQQSRQLIDRDGADLMLLDLELPDGSGFDLLDELDLAQHSGRVAIVTGTPSIESAARAVSMPVVDYLIKPLCPIQFDALLADARTRTPRPLPSAFGGLIGECEAMQGIVRDLCKVAPTTASVLITGESGTGKELIARAVHEQSARRGKFVAVNCGAIAPELLASHLFGHERGSFTGAANRHIGYFEQAHQGTLFLDEITEMPPGLQVYLLRALETGQITRVGGLDPIDVNVRIVAATNRDPEVAIEKGVLREDLFYRLADFIVTMPPLRARGDDVLLLAQVFVDRLNQQYGQHKRLASDAHRVLMQHGWPGNVRELRSAIQRAYVLSDGDTVRLAMPGRRVAPMHQDEMTVTFTVGMTYAEVEREMLLKTLARFNHDKTQTARALGVSVRTIHNQLARIGDAPLRHEGTP